MFCRGGYDGIYGKLRVIKCCVMDMLLSSPFPLVDGAELWRVFLQLCLVLFGRCVTESLLGGVRQVQAGDAPGDDASADTGTHLGGEILESLEHCSGGA